MYTIIWNFKSRNFKTQLSGSFFKDYLRSFIHRARKYFLEIAWYPYEKVIDERRGGLLHLVKRWFPPKEFK